MARPWNLTYFEPTASRFRIHIVRKRDVDQRDSRCSHCHGTKHHEQLGYSAILGHNTIHQRLHHVSSTHICINRSTIPSPYYKKTPQMVIMVAYCLSYRRSLILGMNCWQGSAVDLPLILTLTWPAMTGPTEMSRRSH